MLNPNPHLTPIENLWQKKNTLTPEKYLVVTQAAFAMSRVGDIKLKVYANISTFILRYLKKKSKYFIYFLQSCNTLLCSINFPKIKGVQIKQTVCWIKSIFNRVPTCEISNCSLRRNLVRWSVTLWQCDYSRVTPSVEQQRLNKKAILTAPKFEWASMAIHREVHETHGALCIYS